MFRFWLSIFPLVFLNEFIHLFPPLPLNLFEERQTLKSSQTPTILYTTLLCMLRFRMTTSSCIWSASDGNVWHQILPALALVQVEGLINLNNQDLFRGDDYQINIFVIQPSLGGTQNVI